MKDFRYLVYFGVYITDVWRIAHHWERIVASWKQSDKQRDKQPDKDKSSSIQESDIFGVITVLLVMKHGVLYRIQPGSSTQIFRHRYFSIFILDQISGT